MHLTFCELILKDSVGKGATQCTFDELINKRPGSIIRDVRVEQTGGMCFLEFFAPLEENSGNDWVTL